MILDTGDGTSLNPVDGLGVGSLVEESDVFLIKLTTDISEHLLVLRVVPVGELVVTSGVSLVAGVDLINEFVGLDEVGKSGVEVGDINVALAPFSNVLEVVEGGSVDHCKRFN